MKFAIAPLLAAALLAPSAHAALQGRDLDPTKAGFEAYYDTDLNISWLTDFGYVAHSGFDVDARLSWNDAQTWIAGLNQQHLYGLDGWRLPTVGPVNGSSFQLGSTNNGHTDVGVAATGTGWGTASEMGHLYYVTLGNKGLCTPTVLGTDACSTQPGWSPTAKNFGPFTGLTTFVFWSGTTLPSQTNQAFYFYAYYGNQDVALKTQTYSAIAVRDGDVAAAVPEPGAAALMLGGLAGLGLRARRRR
jgi:hypothetical protein